MCVYGFLGYFVMDMGGMKLPLYPHFNIAK